LMSLYLLDCSSPSGNLVSCFLLTSCLCSLGCLSYGNVICYTSYLRSLSCPSCGDVIYGTSLVYLVTYTIIDIGHTIVGHVDGSTLALMIFCAHVIVLSYSFFTPELEAPPSSS
jgi:hypothetical protein